jgi:hypothetical protein
MMGKKKAEQEAVRAEVVAAMKAQSPSDRERRIVLLWGRWEEAKAYLAKVRSDHRIQLAQAQDNLKQTMEGTVDARDDQAALRKLHSIEVCWQDVEEIKASARDAIGGARDGVKGTYEQLHEAVQATQQIDLDFGGGTVQEHEADRAAQ